MTDDLNLPNEISPQAVTLIQRYARTLFRYEKLMEISRKLSGTLDINDLLKQIVNSAAEMTGAVASSILLVEARTGVLRFEAAVDTTGFSFYDVEVPIGNSIAGWVVENREPVIIDDADSDPRFYRGVDEQSNFVTENVIAVPMITRDRVIGCMQALNKPGGFVDEDLSTMNTLASQAAIAIENARLFEQTDLIAEMVHELRTPLAAIKATTYILDRPQLEADKHSQLLRTIAGETERLTRLTTEFLDLARLESGRTRIQQHPVDLVALARDSLETVHAQAEEKDVELRLHTEPVEGFPTITGDGTKLKQVLLNLLTNAIKYNREGGTVTVNLLAQPETVYVGVTDTGFGINQRDLPHIFDKFYRVSDTEGFTQGTGLGLAVVKRVVEGHGGAVDVESEDGVGTTFFFTLPY